MAYSPSHFCCQRSDSLVRSQTPISGPINTGWTIHLLFPKASERHKSLIRPLSYARYYFSPITDMSHLNVTTNLQSTQHMSKTKGIPSMCKSMIPGKLPPFHLIDSSFSFLCFFLVLNVHLLK